MTGGPPATPYSAFLDQVAAGNVATVTFQGTRIDGRFKHALANTGPNGTVGTDTFHSRVPDFGDSSLISELREQHVAIDVTSPTSWTRVLGALPLPMLFFVGVAVIVGLVRLARGGKSQSGPAIPTHPMQGMVGLVSGLFGKPREVESPSARGSDAAKSS
jgi:hypothetical protein